VVCPALWYFLKVSHKRHYFRKEVIEHKICVLIFSSNLSKIFHILRRRDQDVIIDVCILVFTTNTYYSCQFLIKLELSGQIFIKYSNFMKILPLGAEFFHAERRTDRHNEDNREFSNFFRKCLKTRDSLLVEMVVGVTQNRKWHSVKRQIDSPSLVMHILTIFYFISFKINDRVSLRGF
jgi:hypothetical protein